MRTSIDTTLDALDFTSSGAFTSEATTEPDIVEQITSETESTIQTLEQAMEDGAINEASWQLLASFYLGTNRINEFNAIKTQYEDYFNASVFTELCHDEHPQSTNQVIFEMPQKLTEESLPEITTVMEACHLQRGVLVDFSSVRGTDTKGLKALTRFFVQLVQNKIEPETPGLDSFIANLEKNTDSDSGTDILWETLFGYYRFRNDVDMFDDLAIRYAMKFSISPPSWK